MLENILKENEDRPLNVTHLIHVGTSLTLKILITQPRSDMQQKL